MKLVNSNITQNYLNKARDKQGDILTTSVSYKAYREVDASIHMNIQFQDLTHGLISDIVWDQVLDMK